MLVLHMHIHLPISYEGVPTHGADARPSHSLLAFTTAFMTLIYGAALPSHHSP